jgi:hypothetical protein
MFWVANFPAVHSTAEAQQGRRRGSSSLCFELSYLFVCHRKKVLERSFDCQLSVQQFHSQLEFTYRLKAISRLRGMDREVDPFPILPHQDATE